MSRSILSRSPSSRPASLPTGFRLLVGLFLLLGLTFAGCGRQDASPEPQDASSVPPSDEPAEAPDVADGEADSTSEAETVEASLAKLSDEERALAEEQGICPVTEKPLGWMGTPVKITVEGRDVFLCCAGCEKPVRDAPNEHFEKLDQN